MPPNLQMPTHSRISMCTCLYRGNIRYCVHSHTRSWFPSVLSCVSVGFRILPSCQTPLYYTHIITQHTRFHVKPNSATSIHQPSGIGSPLPSWYGNINFLRNRYRQPSNCTLVARNTYKKEQGSLILIIGWDLGETSSTTTLPMRLWTS